MARLTINLGDNEAIACQAVIVVPEQAVAEPGYIRVLTEGGGRPDKHAVQALAQTACYRYQDDELEVAELTDICRISGPNGVEEVRAGMIIYREISGNIRAAAHQDLDIRKLLETAHRYCTRWVRLDI